MERPARGNDWIDGDREAFWAYVRARMAMRRLKHADVAAALRMDRSVLSRRLNGEIRERPTEWMLDRLVEVLALEAAEREDLAQLAGVNHCSASRPEDDAGAPSAEPPEAALTARPNWRDTAGRRRTAPRWLLWVAAPLAIVAAVAAGWVLRGLNGDRAPVVAQGSPIKPGGVWLAPVNGDAFSGGLHFSARAFPTNPGEPAIAVVQFTVSWPGRPGPWLVACRATAPSHGDVYECDWTPGADVPAGPLQASFDVYDRARPPNSNLSPNGVHAVTYQPQR